MSAHLCSSSWNTVQCYSKTLSFLIFLCLMRTSDLQNNQYDDCGQYQAEHETGCFTYHREGVLCRFMGVLMQSNTVHIHFRRSNLDCHLLTFTLHNQSFSLRQRPRSQSSYYPNIHSTTSYSYNCMARKAQPPHINKMKKI